MVDGAGEGDLVAKFLPEVREREDGAVPLTFDGEVFNLVPGHEKELPFERAGSLFLRDAFGAEIEDILSGVIPNGIGRTQEEFRESFGRVVVLIDEEMVLGVTENLPYFVIDFVCRVP